MSSGHNVKRRHPRHAALVASVVLTSLLTLGVAAPGTATDGADGDGTGAAGQAGVTSTDLRFTTSDGVSIKTTLTGASPMRARPTIVEFSPYGNASQTVAPGPAYNVLLVQIRGTGDSDGRFDAMGPRVQADVPEVLRWACDQPWSNGDLALNGFSASAIVVYNSMHLELPCVKAAVLKSGTFELYRDLLVPGGITNLLPGAGVIGLISAPALVQGPDRLRRNPSSALDAAGGLLQSGLNAGLLHPSLDSWWRQRGFRGEVNKLPILMIDGFYDVESRGAFQAYQALRDNGAHLLVIGAHDGAPAGTDGGAAESAAWFDHFVRGVDNGVEAHPRVQLWMADGDREDDLAGRFVRYDGSDWPVPGTSWSALNLDATRSHSAHSLNDGTLTLEAPARAKRQAYPSIPSMPFNSDPPNTAIVGGMGLNALTAAVPILSDMTLAETLGLTYTTAALKSDVLSAGPASLEVELASTSAETGIWAVLSDVSPDGVAHPITAGRLLSSYPDIDRSRSLVDPATGNVVQPYGVFDHKTRIRPGKFEKYHVELWPVGNRFKAGHRIRLQIVGASAASMPTIPGLNTVKVGGASGSRLLFPVLPGSDLGTALG